MKQLSWFFLAFGVTWGLMLTAWIGGAGLFETFGVVVLIVILAVSLDPAYERALPPDGSGRVVWAYADYRSANVKRGHRRPPYRNPTGDAPRAFSPAELARLRLEIGEEPARIAVGIDAAGEVMGLVDSKTNIPLSTIYPRRRGAPGSRRRSGGRRATDQVAVISDATGAPDVTPT